MIIWLWFMGILFKNIQNWFSFILICEVQAIHFWYYHVHFHFLAQVPLNDLKWPLIKHLCWSSTAVIKKLWFHSSPDCRTARWNGKILKLFRFCNVRFKSTFYHSRIWKCLKIKIISVAKSFKSQYYKNKRYVMIT